MYQRITRFCFSAIFLTIFFFHPLFSQKYSNEFLAIGIGARAQAMGNAVVASTDDVTATYWNPAGLTFMEESTGLQVGAMHAEWFAGVGKYDYLAATLPLSNSNRRVGLSVIRFGIDGIPNTLSLFESDGTINYNNVVEFSAADYAIMGSYAQPLSVKRGVLSIGGNIKVVRRIIGTFANSWGFGLDLGMQYRRGNWKLGVLARDVSTTFNAWSISFTEDEKQVLLQTGNELPDINSNEITKPGLLAGAAYRFQIKSVGLSPEVNFLATTDGQRNVLFSSDPISVDAGMGVELDYKNSIYLRGGVDQFQKEKDFDGSESYIMRPSLGVGLRIAALQVDYAYTDLGDQRNTYSHVISLHLSWKRKSGG